MKKPAELLIWASIGAVMLPWLICAAQISMNGDVAWLVHAAQRVIEGSVMTDRFYDNNPPISFMIYIPVVWIAALGVPLWYASDIYTVIVGILSIAAVATLLRRAPGLQKHNFWLVVIGFIAAITFPARLELGQKDHLLAIALLPFLLAQFALLDRWSVERWVTLTVMVMAIPFILVKPHYLLLPSLIVFYRIVTQRRIAADSVVIIAVSAAYAAVIWLRFPDFLSEVLEASARLYAAEIYAMVWPAVTGFGLVGACVLGIAMMIDQNAPARRFCIFLSAMALWAVVPVLLQFKGFSTHFLPPLALMVPAAFVTLGEVSGKASWRGWPYALLVLASGYFVLPVPQTYPTHEMYNQSTLAKVIGQEHSVFIQTDTTNVIEPLSIYTGVTLATRFPSLWFMPGLMQHSDKQMAESFCKDIMADMVRYKPNMVMLYAHPAKNSDFLKFMDGDKNFRKEWAHYKKSKPYVLNPAEYFAGTRLAARPPVVYNIYRRIP